ncbi:MAG: hypothetical protein HQM16_15895 [Deltaproteobacteria bacterium]|nr:hypothetical protein [Deltaproteobacteria bacterium]
MSCNSGYDGLAVDCHMQQLDTALSRLSELDGERWQRGDKNFVVDTNCNTSELLDLNSDGLTRERFGAGYIATQDQQKFTRFLYMIAPVDDYPTGPCVKQFYNPDNVDVSFCMNRAEAGTSSAPTVVRVGDNYVFLLDFEGGPLMFDQWLFYARGEDVHHQCTQADRTVCAGAAVSCRDFGPRELSAGNYSASLAGEGGPHEITLSANHESSRAVYSAGGGCGGDYFEGFERDGVSTKLLLDSSNLYVKEKKVVKYVVNPPH